MVKLEVMSTPMKRLEQQDTSRSWSSRFIGMLVTSNLTTSRSCCSSFFIGVLIISSLTISKSY
jgi:hypothetical protein